MESVKARSKHEISMVFKYADSYGDIGGGDKVYRSQTSIQSYRGLHFCVNTCQTMFNLYAGYTE